MSQLDALLQTYFERSAYKSIGELAKATRSHAPVSKSYIAHMLRGTRQNPAYDKLMAIAQALALSPAETNRLLAAAGHPPLPAQNPQIERAVSALDRLSQTPGISAEAVRMVVDGLVLMVEGLRSGLGHSAGPLPAVRPLMEAPLTPDEGEIDELLGELLGEGIGHPLDGLFASLEETARSGRWEAKRRLAEALPRLVQLQPEGTLRLATILRDDYHPDYRADIRRRVIEATPALYSYRPEPARALFAWREQDEVYVAMATVEALHDMHRAGLMSAADETALAEALRYAEPLHESVVAFLRQMLQAVAGDPDAALAELNKTRGHPERLFRIAVQRVAPRLLPARPAEALALLAHFLRRGEDGQPLEHQNLRRPVSKALPEIMAALLAEPALEPVVGQLLTLLARDPDIHVRRALSDALDRLAQINEVLAGEVLAIMSEDEDPYISQRALHTLLVAAEGE
jgi:transcriptional regulator with XRE-family HTH domain